MTDVDIEARALTHHFGAHLAVCNVSFSVLRGRVFALLGQNGAGKTTTLRMLLGLLQPSSGEARVLGENSQRLAPNTRARIGYMSEGCALYDWMRVGECADFQRAFYPRFNDRLYRAIVDAFRLRGDQRIRDLSRGQRAGVNLALVLATEPEVLLLDDPALGLDPMARRLLLEGMVHFSQRARCTILFSSHLLADVERVADDVAILDAGALSACCSVETFRERVTQYALHFDDEPPSLPTLPGLLQATRLPREWRITLANETRRTTDVLRTLGASSMEPVGMSFEDAVIAFMGRRGETSFVWAEDGA